MRFNSRVVMMWAAGALVCGAQSGSWDPVQMQKEQANRFLARGPGGGTGVQMLEAKSLRDGQNRTYPYPVKGHKVLTNPVVFTWPMSDYVYAEVYPRTQLVKPLDQYDRYGFQMSRSPDFPEVSTRTVTGLRLPFYNPHRKMEPGVWFWRYRVENAAGPQAWSKTYEMTMDPAAPIFESPTADEAFAMLPRSFPRIYKSLDTATNAWNGPLVDDARRVAQQAMNKMPADYVVKGQPIPADARPEEVKQIEHFRTVYEINGLCGALTSLMDAYRVDRKPEYLAKAQIYCDALLDRGMSENTSVHQALAAYYDAQGTALPPATRDRIEALVNHTMPELLGYEVMENIGSADGILSEHFFQFIFRGCFNPVIVMHDRLPQAKEWFSMLYEIWLARSPAGGFSDDGCWPNGNQGYFQVNMLSMVESYLFFREFFGVNLFTHPWYRNCGLAMIYTFPQHSGGDGFGDGSEYASPPPGGRYDFAYILGRESGNPYAVGYAYAGKKLQNGKLYSFERNQFEAYRLRVTPELTPAAPLKNLPQAAVLAESGQVSMHTSLADTPTNLFLSFRSSPFGVGSHGHADQNSFNLLYGGEPLFYSVGYRLTTKDKHHLANNKHSRAKNTVTVDGKTQAFGDCGYGWIARYLHGEQITYTLGDASRAYQAFPRGSINWATVCKTAGLYTSDQGFILNEQDDPQVKLFRRHIAMLRPSTILIYDELESAKPVTWEWRLNSQYNSPMVSDPVAKKLTVNGAKADAQATVFGSTNLMQNLLSGYLVPPVDWLNPQRGRAAREFDPAQFQSTTINPVKTRAMRYLAVIQVDRSNRMQFQDVKPNAAGVYEVNGYQIQAELDIKKPARLEVRDPKTGAHLLYGEGSEGFKDRKYSRSTLLYEKATGQQEAVDTLPLMVPGEQR